MTTSPAAANLMFLFLLSPATVSADGLAGPPVTLTPRVIEMGSFYSGAKITITCAVSKASKLIIVVRGADTEEVFNKKARFGFVWANAGKVRISGVPSLFLCFSSEPVHTLLNPDTIRQRLLNEPAIKSHMKIEPRQEGAGDSAARAEYLDLKKKDGLYRIQVGQFSTKQGRAGDTLHAVEFLWPKKAPPASYKVSVLECQDGMVVAESHVPLEVVKIGFPAELAILARQYSALYGMVAVLVAVAAGFGIDFIAARLFGAKRVAH